MNALVIGIGGQDGSYIAETLLSKGYKVYGTSRRSSVDNLWRVETISTDIEKFYKVDLTEPLSIQSAIMDCQPDVIFNEADQDNIGWSYSLPGYSIDVTVKGVSNLLECVAKFSPESRVFIPTSATIFGTASSYQKENTQHNPLSPYACAKLHAYHLARYYRQVHNLFVSTGILYNHDSPRRSKEYLLQHIYHGLKKFRQDNTKRLRIGALDMYVDIGYAREFAEGIVKIMELDNPTDVILATGRGYTIKHILEHYKQKLGIYSECYTINEDFRYPGPQTELIGSTHLAQELIGWKPRYDAVNMFNILSGMEK